MLGAAPATSVTIDDSQARATLAILHKLQHRQAATSADWERLFATSGYRRLKEREAAFHAPFTDAAFKAFVENPALVAQSDALQRTLDTWASADLSQMEARARAYLPPDSVLHATVYPLIKPRTNSFVYKLDTNPAIMLYLNPSVTRGQFSNTVSHELFHAGDAENCPPSDVAAAEQVFSTKQRMFLEWLSAFGEGSAVLAAAGGPNVHPHAEDSQHDRQVWDAAMTQFPKDFQSLQTFFEEIAGGALSGDEIATKGMTYFGDVQGPWYTVGYKMDVTIERQLGRPALIAALCDKRNYLHSYDTAAAQVNARTPGALPRWPDDLADFLNAPKF